MRQFSSHTLVLRNERTILMWWTYRRYRHVELKLDWVSNTDLTLKNQNAVSVERLRRREGVNCKEYIVVLDYLNIEPS